MHARRKDTNDLGTLDTHTATIDWGDGTATDLGLVTELPFGPPGNTAGASGMIAGSHVYADNGTYTVTVAVRDDDGGVGADTLIVTVTNVVATVDAGVHQTVGEGTVISLASVTFNDLGTLDTHTATINWGDGTATDVGLVTELPFGPPGNTAGASGMIAGSHVYADNGTYTVTVAVRDDDGAVGTDALVVTVTNVVPTVDAGVDQMVAEGTVISLASVTFNDLGTLDTHTATINWGDGTVTQVGLVTEMPFGPPGSTAGADGAITGSHAYADNGTYTVTVTVTDDDGAASSDTLAVTVANVAPTVNAGPDGLTTLSGAFTSVGSFADPGSDSWTATVDYGDGSGVQALELTDKTFRLSHTYAIVGAYEVTVIVMDDDGGIGIDSALVSLYAFGGFLPPLSNQMVFALRRTIPVKFQLKDASGNFVSDLSGVTGIFFGSSKDPNNATTPAGPAGSTAWRYDSAENQYIFNWQTKGQVTSPGCYTIKVTFKDGTYRAKSIEFSATGGSAKLTADSAADATGGATAGSLLGGDVALLVDNQSGQLDAQELARVQDAVTAINVVLTPYGVTIYQVDAASAAAANVTLEISATSVVGGFAEGVLGCTEDGGKITLVQGWNWYAGSDATAIGRDQYDFQTVVTHEVGHALGLGHGAASTSAMYATLASGVTNRTLSADDLNVANRDSGHSALRAALRPACLSSYELVAWLPPTERADPRHTIQVLVPGEETPWPASVRAEPLVHWPINRQGSAMSDWELRTDSSRRSSLPAAPMPVAAVDAFFALEQGDDAWQNPDDIDLLCDELANLQIHGAIDNMPARIE